MRLLNRFYKWHFFTTKTCLFKYTEYFTTKKGENFQIKNSDIFQISPQNIDSGYSLEPPRRGGSNEYPQSMFFAEIRKLMYTPVNPGFTIKKWGLRGLKLYRHVFLMCRNYVLSWYWRNTPTLKWAAMSGNVPSDICAQRRFLSACVFAQSDQNLHWTHFKYRRMQKVFMRTRKTLMKLRGCVGWSESSLGTHVRGTFTRVAVQFIIVQTKYDISFVSFMLIITTGIFK